MARKFDAGYYISEGFHSIFTHGVMSFAAVCMIVACLLNIVLDIVFVANMGMTADGVALATVIAQAISAALCLWRLTHIEDTLKLTKKSLIPDKEISKQIRP